MTIPFDPSALGAYGDPIKRDSPEPAPSPRSLTVQLVVDDLRARGLTEAADLIESQAATIERLRARLDEA